MYKIRERAFPCTHVIERNVKAQDHYSPQMIWPNLFCLVKDADDTILSGTIGTRTGKIFTINFGIYFRCSNLANCKRRGLDHLHCKTGPCLHY